MEFLRYDFCLLFSCGWAIISCFFVCLVIFLLLLKTGQFEYYSLITLEIRFSSFLSLLLLFVEGYNLFSDFSKLFFSAETSFLAMYNHGNLYSIMSLVSQ